jgi:hypothetical protein
VFEPDRLSAQTAPTGNPTNTYTSFSLQGTTEQSDEREFLISFGLESNLGNNSRPTPYHDKVTLYVGMEAGAGTGDVWAINPLVTQLPNSGNYTAQGT